MPGTASRSRRSTASTSANLRGSHHTNERVGESLLRLMGAIAQVRIERDAGEGEGPETFTRRVQLLGRTDEIDA